MSSIQWHGTFAMPAILIATFQLRRPTSRIISHFNSGGQPQGLFPISIQSTPTSSGKTEYELMSHTCQGYPGYFQEPHWKSMGLPEISRVIWQLHVSEYSYTSGVYITLLFIWFIWQSIIWLPEHQWSKPEEYGWNQLAPKS